jgi:asparagine synthase (glutamine-hydrolysing)
MSGIVAILNVAGQPVDRELLGSMTDYMHFRGPDDRQVWFGDCVGLGHTMLRTTFEQEREQQPCSLDGHVWITADARIDDRAELKRKLTAKGREDVDDATDVDLILHAFHAWGKDCVDHLIGDFAFIIWDGRVRQLFCARDHFGVKPLYYAQIEAGLIFSNTLNVIRLHPAVSAGLNELAIADFLLFGYNQEADTTTFADIRRVPPAHTLTWQDGAVQVNRYWTLPIEETVRYKRSEEYIERFQELFWQAVDDRLRTDSVGVFMSGGLDSTSVAAVAKDLLSKQHANFDLRAYTVVYDELIPDEERYWSGLAAEHIGIPIHYLVADDYELFERWDQPELYMPEPTGEPFQAISVDQNRQIAARHRVALTGYGGDPLLYPSSSYFTGLMKRLRFGRLVSDIYGYSAMYDRLPPLYFGTWLRRWLGQQPWRSKYPEWLNPELERAYDLPQRWESIWQEPPSCHPEHPEAYRYLTSHDWPGILTAFDADSTGVPVEAWHPFFDLRLVQFVLQCPAFPWCVDKRLLRETMRGFLPDAVRQRPKAPLAGEPPLVRYGKADNGLTGHLEMAAAELVDYVDLAEIALRTPAKAPEDIWNRLRVHSLERWFSYFDNHIDSRNLLGEKYGNL